MRKPPKLLRVRRAALRCLGAGLGLLAPAAAAPGDVPQLLYATEGNRLRRLDPDTLDAAAPRTDVLVESAGGGGEGGAASRPGGRDVNGLVCRLPGGSGRFLLGEDTGQPHPPPGWGIFSGQGVQIGKLTPTTFAPPGEVGEPFGCAFDSQGILFTTEVGEAAIGSGSGQLIQWFPPYEGYPGPPGVYPDTDAVSTNFCKLAVDLGTATGIAIDEQDRVYVAAAAEGRVYRFSPPFPTGPDPAGGCGRTDALGSPLADPDRAAREVFIDHRLAFPPTGLARTPDGGWYVSSVVFGRVVEFDADGEFVRTIVDLPPGEDLLTLPHSTGSPQSLAVDRDGTLYYADLDLRGPFFAAEPGDDGKVRRVRFDAAGNPGPPQTILSGLAFPDGVSLLPGELEPVEWRSYAGGPRRLFFNPAETTLNRDDVADLRPRWRFPTGAVITASPTVALVDLPGEGPTQVVYFLSWDLRLYAVRLRDGSEVWRVPTEDQPGASFPATASVDVTRVDGRDRAYVGQGETFYSFDAATGEEYWRFVAGTGCRDGLGHPPGLCGFSGERNQIESSALVHEGVVYFGMDVNDVATGRGGFYALDARDGRLLWFFDPESGSTCRPHDADEVRRFDGHHTEAELGLPPGFLASRPGCGFDRTPTGCANIWSSPALDAGRGLLFVASSNCDTDLDPQTPVPPPPMPPFDEALFALHLDGTPAWRWRPREVDNDDLAFGAAPQLFAIEAEGRQRDVVGVGSKDGTYYVVDRDGVNELSGVAWNDPDPSALPYWATRVVPGGDIGGILATAAVDEERRRVYFSTAPGTSEANDPGASPPQRPTVHALDLDTGAVVWQNVDEPSALASFAPTSAIPGVVFAGQLPFAFLRAYETADDASGRLATIDLDNFALASAPVVVNGTLLVGAGIGTRTQSGSGLPDITASVPSDLTALCVPGSAGCDPCRDGFDNDDDGAADHPDDPACTSPDDLSEENDCEDGLDNDRDGRRDFPADPDCLEATGVTEVPAPGRLAGAIAALLASAGCARRRLRLASRAAAPGCARVCRRAS
jgi:outer membrane protein assembly factor BamB